MKRSPLHAKAFRRAIIIGVSAISSGCASEAVARKNQAVSLPGESPVCLKLSELFVSPVGPRGLEPTEKLRSLEGRRVRLTGYMVDQDRRLPGRFLLVPRPARVHEEHYGLAEDLPPATVHVLCPVLDLAYSPLSLDLVGTLRLGNRVEPDGRISVVRLELERYLSGDVQIQVPSSRSKL